MKYLKVSVFLFFGACLAGLMLLASGQAEQVKATAYVNIDWYLTPADFPCLAETIHLTGALEENLHIVINPAGGYSWQYKQTGALKGLTAVGLTTGAEYKFRGPYLWIENGSTDEPWVTWYPLEWTHHELDHFIGPQNFYLRILWHVTFDRETGDLKVEVLKEDAICR